jgi:transcriptional regulator with XRE-family HTH domain
MDLKPISLCYTGDMKAGRPERSERSTFSERLRSLREAAGISQRGMAAKLGISQPSYQAWEAYNVALKPEQLAQLAEALAVPIESFFDSPAKTKAAKKRGPAGKAQQVFEMVSKLPKPKQDRILGVVEALLAQEAVAS